MQKTLYALIELQEVDKRLDELMEERGDLPLLVEELTQKTTEKKEELKNLKSDLKDAKLKRGELELFIKEAEEKVKKYDEQLYQVKTNKEYDAITAETETVREELNSSEDALLDLDQKIEDLEQAIAQSDEEISTLESELETNTNDLNARMSETAEEENMLRQERIIIVQKLSSQVVKSYEMVREARDGTGIARVVGGSCGGCYSYIPPQKIVEIKKMQKLYTCEFCGRILVWDESQA